jgi:hypothetical protein
MKPVMTVMLVLTILVMKNKDVHLDVSTKVSTVMMVIAVLMIIVTLPLDVDTPPLTVMITTLVPRTPVMKNVNIFTLTVMIIMHVLLMTVTARLDVLIHLSRMIGAMIIMNVTLNIVILKKVVSMNK